MADRELVEALKQATREAHEALQDMKNERTALQETHAAIQVTIQDWIDNSHEAFTKIVKDHVKALGDATGQAIEDASQAVYRRFDQLTRILLGEEDGDQDPSLIQLTRRVRATMIGEGLDMGTIPPAFRRSSKA